MGRLLALVAVAVSVVTPLPAAAASAPPPCPLMAVTPSGAPLVVWCAVTTYSSTAQTNGVRLWRSAGDGRWVQARAANLVVTSNPGPPQPSPQWARDRTLYWATSGGLFRSTDLGETFSIVSPLVTGQQHPIRRVFFHEAAGEVRAAVAGYDPHDVGYVATGAGTVPALGSPDEDLIFTPHPQAGFGVLAWDVATASAHRVTAFRCTDAFACGERWFELPAPTDGFAHQLTGAWRRAGAAAGEPLYFAVRGGTAFARVSLWSAGAKLSPLPAADRAVAALTDGRNAPTVMLAFDRGRIFLRVLSSADSRRAAHDRIYSSTDGGASWRVVAAAVTDASGRSRGPSGWRPGAVSIDLVPTLATHGTKLLANVSDGVRYTFRCSNDGGSTWSPSCA